MVLRYSYYASLGKFKAAGDLKGRRRLKKGAGNFTDLFGDGKAFLHALDETAKN
jgi:hypothetical protein